METATNISPRSQQQEFYEYFGDASRVTWDLYNLEKDVRSLERKIGFALFGAPAKMPDGTVQDSQGKLIHHTGYDDKQVAIIEQISKQIIAQNKFSFLTNELHMAVLFVLCVHNKDGTVPNMPVRDNTSVVYELYPVFRIRKCVKNFTDNSAKSKPITNIVGDEYDSRGRCFIFVDHEGRAYKSWNAYLENNRLPKGILVVPMDGIYNATVGGSGEAQVLLTEHKSPACSVLKRVQNCADTAGLLASVGATCVGVAAAIPAIPVAAGVMAGAGVVGATSAAYSVIRSSFNLADRSQHKQSLHIKDKEARNDWFGIAGGSIGLAAGGATKLLGNIVGRGVNVGAHGKNLINVLNGVSIAMNGVNVAHGIYQIFDVVVNEKETPDPLLLFQVSTSIFFFTHSIINVRTAETMIKDKQNEVIEEYKNNLRSNRHRKMFTKMEKETIRLAGNEASGRSDIIRFINNVNDKNDFFAGAIRINKGLNANNVKISFSPDGYAKLNNVETIDPMQFWATDRTNQASTFSRLPPPPSSTVQTVQLRSTQANVQNIIKLAITNKTIIMEMLHLVQHAQNGGRNAVIERISFYLCSFVPYVQEMFMQFLFTFIEKAELILHDQLGRVLQGGSVNQFEFLFNFLYAFLSEQTYLLLKDQGLSNNSFFTEMQNIIKKLCGSNKERYLIQIMSNLINELEEILNKRQQCSITRNRIDCKICNGYHYEPK